MTDLFGLAQPAYGMAIHAINLRLSGGPMLLLALEPSNARAGTAHLEALGWEPFQMNGFIRFEPLWAAVFDRRARALTSVLRLTDDGQQIERYLFTATAPIPLPPRLWDLVTGQQRVAMVGPLHGDPTGEALRAAEQSGHLRGLVGSAAVM